MNRQRTREQFVMALKAHYTRTTGERDAGGIGFSVWLLGDGVTNDFMLEAMVRFAERMPSHIPPPIRARMDLEGPE